MKRVSLSLLFLLCLHILTACQDRTVALTPTLVTSDSSPTATSVAVGVTPNFFQSATPKIYPTLPPNSKPDHDASAHARSLHQ